jgi:hypothetical protein
MSRNEVIGLGVANAGSGRTLVPESPRSAACGADIQPFGVDPAGRLPMNRARLSQKAYTLGASSTARDMSKM